MSSNDYRKCAKCGKTRAEDMSVTYHRFPNPGKVNILKSRAWAKYCWPNEDWTCIALLRSLYVTNKVLCGRHFDLSKFYDNKKQHLCRYAIPDTVEIDQENPEQSCLAGQSRVPFLQIDNIQAAPLVEQSMSQQISMQVARSLESKDEELNESDSHVPEEQAYVTVENDVTTEEVAHAEERGVNDKHKSNTDNCRKRVLVSNTVPEVKTSVKKSRHDIDDVIIDYDNIDKFGEQIAFLLKRIPRQLCRELQDSIVTLVKTATRNNYGSKINVNVPANTSSCTKQLKTTTRKYGSNTNRDVSANTSVTKQIKKIISATEHDHGSLTKKNDTESPSFKQIKTTISTAARDYKSINKRNTTTNSFTKQIKTPISATTGNYHNITKVTALKVPKPMPLPMELIEETDCLKQEILDPEQTGDQVIHELCHEDVTTTLMLSDPLLDTEMKVYLYYDTDFNTKR